MEGSDSPRAKSVPSSPEGDITCVCVELVNEKRTSTFAPY
jgi:hypothetical protein